MRRLAIVLALAACSGGASRGPTWPARQDPETDGGESLEPRTAAAGAVEATRDADPDADEPDNDIAALFTDAAAAAATPGDPATPAAATPAGDDVILTEEITIEITDDD